jgi:hypothetical protein
VIRLNGVPSVRRRIKEAMAAKHGSQNRWTLDIAESCPGKAASTESAHVQNTPPVCRPQPKF